MAEHGRGIVHEPRRKDKADRLGIELVEPIFEPLTRQRRQTSVIKQQAFFQPVVSGHECALRGLLRATDDLVDKKMSQRGGKLGLRVGFPLRSKKEPRIVLHTLYSTEPRPAVMEEDLPLTLLREAQDCGTAQQFVQIRLVAEWAADSVRGNKAREEGEQENDREDSEKAVRSQSLQPEPHGDNN
ncbi:hypothetical protein NITLEN_20413 [Nitrospira lenta]|uniref:Uncharacterized protein n=1 Tax=Nitrospira lenta TaxID=1436998 RepID=A0A330L4U2_9BACT|nr:hypothetical protein NITLEN_20413 [Nitrospira lenta]